jgi:hypothetical protein
MEYCEALLTAVHVNVSLVPVNVLLGVGDVSTAAVAAV